MPELGIVKVSGYVRHVVDFSRIPNIQNIGYNVSPKLEKFFGFIHNSEKKRVSFIVANNTSFYKNHNATEIYSTDPNIQIFNKIVQQSNPHLNLSNATYDMKDKDMNESLLNWFSDPIGNISKDFGIDKKVVKYILIGGILFTFVYFVRKKNEKQNRKA
ncbi:MAG: hypothetical protein SFU98_16370 [Leptospiraceae bacterium]|nr:hypothetical protein [Leptospiraceae bacterium]